MEIYTMSEPTLWAIKTCLLANDIPVLQYRLS